MPDVQALERDRIVADYLKEMQSLQSEQARSHRFSLLLQRLFGLQPNFIENYVAGVESSIKATQQDVVLRGRPDALFGNVVIEFERDLSRSEKRQEAEEQLRRYIAVLWSNEGANRTPYVAIATDGVRFRVYAPLTEAPNQAALRPEELRLELLDELNAASLAQPGDFYFWLDRYLLRQELLSPRTENIIKDFGPQSHAFQVCTLRLREAWSNIKIQSEFSVIYETWGKYLQIVYGSPQDDDELFIRHTYLALLAKLMVWARLSGVPTALDTASQEDWLEVLEGRLFKKQGIENFLEEDFFSWPARSAVQGVGLEVLRYLGSLLRNYNLRELSEDVLKSLYQDLVEPKTRHELGEYYTPDWLAARVVEQLLESNPKARMLDPSCGSGTFLYHAIRIKRRLLGDSVHTLNHIQEAVVGIDIHPLAVIVSKTNYLLALGDLLLNRRGKITLPIYLANAIYLPERDPQPTLWRQLPCYRIELDGKPVYIPEDLLKAPVSYDLAIEAAREFAEWCARQEDAPTKDNFFKYLQGRLPELTGNPPLAKALFEVSKTLWNFIRERRDTIWAFVLKNTYKPLFLKEQFDAVVGNPPWLSYRYVRQPEYQAFLKKQITEEYRLLTGKGHLITHMELGTLFLVRAADLYLKEGGTIAFVLPRSLFTADQHAALRSASFARVRLTWTELWDLEKVEPLFKVPSCVLIARKEPVSSARQSPQDIPGLVFSGTLPRKNANMQEAESALQREPVTFYLNRQGKRSFWAPTQEGIAGGSPYRKRFFQGATLVPRTFWFVEIQPLPLGFDPSEPPLMTSQRAQDMAKEPYRDLRLQGNVESRFLYATLLSTDLLPFGHLDFRLVVLPIEPADNRYRLIDAQEAGKRALVGLSQWLKRVESEWNKRREAKAETMSALEWLDYRHKLTGQNPQARYRVLYPTSGTYLCACVVENIPLAFQVGGQTVPVQGFVADYVTYCLETESKEEAYYLAAILNAPIVDARIKPIQARGLWGPRHICKKVLELPIPSFDPGNPDHQALAELGQACTRKVVEWLAAGGPGKTQSIGRLRTHVRNDLAQELDRIDALTRRVLSP